MNLLLFKKTNNKSWYILRCNAIFRWVDSTGEKSWAQVSITPPPPFRTWMLQNVCRCTSTHQRHFKIQRYQHKHCWAQSLKHTYTQTTKQSPKYTVYCTYCDIYLVTTVRYCDFWKKKKKKNNAMYFQSTKKQVWSMCFVKHKEVINNNISKVIQTQSSYTT